jgi:hypothetical protein
MSSRVEAHRAAIKLQGCWRSRAARRVMAGVRAERKAKRERVLAVLNDKERRMKKGAFGHLATHALEHRASVAVQKPARAWVARIVARRILAFSVVRVALTISVACHEARMRLWGALVMQRHARGLAARYFVELERRAERRRAEIVLYFGDRRVNTMYVIVGVRCDTMIITLCRHSFLHPTIQVTSTRS